MSTKMFARILTSLTVLVFSCSSDMPSIKKSSLTVLLTLVVFILTAVSQWSLSAVTVKGDLPLIG